MCLVTTSVRTGCREFVSLLKPWSVQDIFAGLTVSLSTLVFSNLFVPACSCMKLHLIPSLKKICAYAQLYMFCL